MNIPFINQVPFSEKILFAKNLALMIRAGLPLRESISTIQEQSKSKLFKKVLASVLNDIENGQSLANSLSRHPKIFDSLYINMIRIGEESATLEESLDRLALYLKKSYELRGKIKSAMIYPSFVLGTTIVLGAGLVFFVLPKIVPLFKTLNVKLPLTTKILIGSVSAMQNYGLLILLITILLSVALFFIYRFKQVKFVVHKIILKSPVIGKISKNVYISRFSQTLGVLLKSGLSVVSALRITRSSLENLVYKKEIEEIISYVQKGKLMSDYLKQKKELFPLMVSRMIGVGEKTGNLEETLLYLSDFYNEEVDNSVKNLSSVLEPILLIIIGLAVGFIALSIISPIYEITRGLHM